MKNVKVIVIAINSEQSPCKLSCADALFSPLYMYTVEQLKKAGFEKIFVAGDVEDKTENNVCCERVENAGLKTIFDHVCKTTEDKDSNLFFVYGDVTYINGDLLESAIARFNDDKIPAIIKDEESRLSAGMLIPFCEMEKLNHEVTSLHRIMDLYGEHMKYTVTTNRILSPKIFLAFCDKVRESVIMRHMEKGVIFTSTDSVTINQNVKIGSGTVIHSGTHLKGGTEIGEDCVLGPNTVVSGSKIGARVKILNSYVTDSTVGDGADIGPYSNIRPGSLLGENVHVGDFVEIKNSALGEGTKAAHLTYIGDSDVGRNVNFGCGVVTVNYDGKKKSRTKIGDNVFVGCNTNFIAPVTVEDNAYIAAGSTITDTVPNGALAIARKRQTVKENWVKNREEQQK